MAALRVLAPQLQLRQLDAEIINALWSICHTARAWGVHADGMLRRNNLIAPADVERLDNWIETISYATMLLLEGAGEDEAFGQYEEIWN